MLEYRQRLRCAFTIVSSPYKHEFVRTYRTNVRLSRPNLFEQVNPRTNTGNCLGIDRRMPATLRETLKKLRTDKGYSLDELARLSGASKSYLWELENRDDRKPSAEKLIDIARVPSRTSRRSSGSWSCGARKSEAANDARGLGRPRVDAGQSRARNPKACRVSRSMSRRSRVTTPATCFRMSPSPSFTARRSVGKAHSCRIPKRRASGVSSTI